MAKIKPTIKAMTGPVEGLRRSFVKNSGSQWSLLKKESSKTPKSFKAKTKIIKPPRILNIFSHWPRTLPSDPAMEPARVKMSPKPATKAKVFIRTLRRKLVFRDDLSCSEVRPVISEKYTPNIGMMQGERKESNPARNGRRSKSVLTGYLLPNLFNRSK